MGIALPERYQIPEFATFERFLFEWLAYQDLYESDFVFQPQSRFVCDPIEEGRIIVDYLGKFETLDTDMKYVAGQIGRSFNVRRSNVTKQPCSDFRGEYKSPEMIDIVGSLYRTDVQLFDYGFES